jgi:AcrR family transcriptional regulator
MDEKHNNFFIKVFELYNKFGIKSVTMDDVSRELGISKKTLYECIEDKSELVKHVMQMVYKFHGEKLEAIAASGLTAIEELMEVNKYMTNMVKELNPTLLYDLRKYYPTLFNELMEEQRRRMHEAILKNLQKGQEQGLYRKDMNIEIISKLHMTRMEYRFSHDSFILNDIDSVQVMREIFIYHLHGIANEQGIKILNDKLNSQWI